MTIRLRQRLGVVRASAAATGSEAAPAPAATPTQRVDRKAGIIHDASAMQAVEALGHDVIIDQTTLEQVAALGNAAPNGIKVRFTHPGMCSDGMGKMLGRQRNFRVVGDRVVGDVHFNESSARTPDGDFRTYVLDLAAEDPASFGMSVVVCNTKVWKLPDGTEISTTDPSLKRDNGEWTWYERPALATTDKPFLRVDELCACDVVDEPAANRDGLFSAAFSGTTNLNAEEAFIALDLARDRLHLSADDLRSFLDRYINTRGLAAAQHKKGDSMKITPQRLAELSKQHPAHALAIIDLAAADKTDVEILTHVTQLAADADKAALTAKLATAEKALADQGAAHAAALKAETDKVTDLTSKLAALQAKHDALSKLGANTPPDVGGSVAPDLSKLQGEPKWRAEFQASTDLQNQFYAGEDSYVAHRRAEIRNAR